MVAYLEGVKNLLGGPTLLGPLATLMLIGAHTMRVHIIILNFEFYDVIKIPMHAEVRLQLLFFLPSSSVDFNFLFSISVSPALIII